MSEVSLQVHVDFCWAGDLVGRENARGVFVRRGQHLLRDMSCLQTLVELSSGEAEVLQDWMTDLPIDSFSDSSAAWSVARRRGLGGYLRQRQTRHWWLQSRVALGDI